MTSTSSSAWSKSLCSFSGGRDGWRPAVEFLYMSRGVPLVEDLGRMRAEAPFSDPVPAIIGNGDTGRELAQSGLLSLKRRVTQVPDRVKIPEYSSTWPGPMPETHFARIIKAFWIECKAEGWRGRRLVGDHKTWMPARALS